MRIAIVTHFVIRGDGQGRVNLEVAAYVLEKGHEVVLLADQVDSALVAAGATWLPVNPVVEKPNLVKVVSFAARADHVLSTVRPRPDLVVANGVVLRRQPVDVNAVHLVHGAWLRSPVHSCRIRRSPYGWYQWLYTRLNATWEQTAFARARLLIAVSERVKADLVSVGVAPDRVHIIPNGVDPTEFRPGPADRAALGVPAEVALALFAGDIRSPVKNLEGVLRALGHIPELHLAVAGDTTGSPYPALAESLGLGQRVHFLGFRHDIAVVMRSADLFVFPSRYDSFGLVLLEALASGVPVVTARTVGASDLVTPDCGIVLDDPEDASGMVEALRDLVRDPARRRLMGRAARARALRQNWRQTGERYLALFERALGSKKAEHAGP